MLEFKLNIKPLSVNQAWQGRRFKTDKYNSFVSESLLMMPTKSIIKSDKVFVYLEFGFSNKSSDIDNPIKPILDVITKKYGIDDRYIYKLEVEKKIVKKGKEYIKVVIEDITTTNN